MYFKKIPEPGAEGARGQFCVLDTNPEEQISVCVWILGLPSFLPENAKEFNL